MFFKLLLATQSCLKMKIRVEKQYILHAHKQIKQRKCPSNNQAPWEANWKVLNQLVPPNPTTGESSNWWCIINHKSNIYRHLGSTLYILYFIYSSNTRWKMRSSSLICPIITQLVNDRTRIQTQDNSMPKPMLIPMTVTIC